jgi:hypothetical protein
LLDTAKGEAEFVDAADIVVRRRSARGIESAGHRLLLRYQKAYAGRDVASQRSDLYRRLGKRWGSDEGGQGGRCP